ncbi:chaperone protein dnaJ 39 isoform X2 [Lolium perenne]|uniref:chaperone protein dnaJ 39 isoform X2 n=1 Tax=Lolium perenne TaxID=4522 RepID=UPI0021F5CC1E|nr:chaperone protein dnaJ 39-like isoform X2 [Lolium perenne]
MFAALFSKLGVPIKTTVSATVLEEALNGSVEISQLHLGKSVCKKVEKQTAHFYSVDITEEEAKLGLVCRVRSTSKSKFKLLYFEPEENGGLSLALQVDSFAIARDSEMHEANRRILSVILRQIDGFEQDRRVVVIAATNRKEDLDPTLISRFDSIICFGLPDQQSRAEIAAQYANHLTKSELVQFSLVTEEMAGRKTLGIEVYQGTNSERREGGSPSFSS